MTMLMNITHTHTHTRFTHMTLVRLSSKSRYATSEMVQSLSQEYPSFPARYPRQRSLADYSSLSQWAILLIPSTHMYIIYTHTYKNTFVINWSYQNILYKIYIWLSVQFSSAINARLLWLYEWKYARLRYHFVYLWLAHSVRGYSH